MLGSRHSAGIFVYFASRKGTKKNKRWLIHKSVGANVYYSGLRRCVIHSWILIFVSWAFAAFHHLNALLFLVKTFLSPPFLRLSINPVLLIAPAFFHFIFPNNAKHIANKIAWAKQCLNPRFGMRCPTCWNSVVCTVCTPEKLMHLIVSSLMHTIPTGKLLSMLNSKKHHHYIDIATAETQRIECNEEKRRTATQKSQLEFEHEAEHRKCAPSVFTAPSLYL